MPSPQELIIILVIIVVIFGAKRIPELGKSLGQGIKEFKKSSKGIFDDSEDDKAPKPSAEKKSESET